MRYIIMILMLSLVGCNSQAKTVFLDDSKGHATRDQIAQSWGPPERTYSLQDGGDVWAYRNCRSRGAIVGNAYMNGVYGLSRGKCTDYVLTFDDRGVLREWSSQ